MADKSQFNRWTPSASDLSNLTVLRARELIVRCFYEAQRETIARAKEKLGFGTTEEDIRASAEGALRMAFTKLNADYEAPTRGTLEQAVTVLIQTSRAFGTPPDIIEHHRAIIEGALARLK